MKEIFTVCARDCYDSCSMIFKVNDNGNIISVKGDPHHPITRGFLCPRGAKDAERLTKNRVDSPLVSGVNVDWNKALDITATKLRQTIEKHGSESVLLLNYSGNMGLISSVFAQRVWNAIGAVRTDGGLCSNSGHRGLELHYGDSHGILPEELSAIDLFVFWGFNAKVSAPHLWALAVETRKERGSKIVVIDPRIGKTAKEADLIIQPRPGTDIALAYGLIYLLIQRGFSDQTFIDRWTTGYALLEEEARRWKPERVEAVSGVNSALLKILSEIYGNRRPSATMIGIGLQKNDFGADQVRAVSLIPAVLGMHRGFFYSLGNSFFIDMDFISGQSLTEKKPGIVEQVALADYVSKGDFKFIYIYGMNPALTVPNQDLFRQGLSRDDVFVVVHDTHFSKTTDFADVVLPAPSFLEKEDLVVPWGHNYIRYSYPVVPPLTQCRSEAQVMQELALRLDLKENWLFQEPKEVLSEALSGALEWGDWNTLLSGTAIKLKTRPRDFYPTPSGKIEFSSSTALEMGIEGLPQYLPLRCDEGKKARVGKLHISEKEFILLNSATSKYTSTQFQEIFGPIPTIVEINPEDANILQIKDADKLKLYNSLGHITAEARITCSVPSGVLWMPRQSESEGGEPQNSLTSSVPQEIGKGPRFNSTRVKVKKLKSIKNTKV